MAATFSTFSGFVGDVGAGGLYILTLAMDWGQGAIAFATADYGTKFMIVAGLLNFYRRRRRVSHRHWEETMKSAISSQLSAIS